jgi:hypothetical protein
VAIGIGSYLYFTPGPNWNGGIAQRDNRAAPDNNANPGNGLAAQDQPEPPGPKGIEGPESPVPPDRGPTEVVAGPEDNKPKEPKTPGGDPFDVFAVPQPFAPGMEPFAIIRPRLSFHVLRDLDQAEPKQQLLQELQKDPGYRLELFCLDSTRAFDRLQTAFKAQGLQLTIEPFAQLRLKHKLPTHFAFFFEDVTPDELAGILERLGSEDKKLAEKRPADGLFGKVLVNPLTQADQKELAKLLGVDAREVEPIRSNAPLGVDIRKPISETTAAQVVQALEGKGGKTDRGVLALVCNPSRVGASTSTEVKMFLSRRKEARAGTVQVLLFLRIPNG